MIFRPDMVEKVLSGEKTVTRRLADDGICACRYRVGQTYAVQPGRGQRAVARIRIVSTDLRPLEHLSQSEAEREGFDSPAAFADRWEELYGVRPVWFANPLSTPLVWRIEFALVTPA